MKLETRYLPHFSSDKVVTGPYYSRKDGRVSVYVRDKYSNSKKGVLQLFSRYLVEQHLQRYLLREEVVDHIDRDPFNDTISNFRIVSSGKNVHDDIPKAKLVEITCKMCNNKALKIANKLRGNSKAGKAGPFCGKSCARLYSNSVQNGKIKPLPVQELVDTKYEYIEKKGGVLIKFNPSVNDAIFEAILKPLTIKPVKEKNKKSKKEATKYDYWDTNYYGRSLHYNKAKRAFIYLIKKDNAKDKRHITYARFLMENHLKKRLDPNTETVDHIDNDATNDSIENLQLLTRSENAIKQNQHNMLIK